MPLQANQMSVHEILEMVFQNKWLFVLCTLLGFLVSFVYVNQKDKWYESRADIQVVDRSASEPLLQGLGVSTSVNMRFTTMRARLLSLGTLSEVVRDLKANAKYKSCLLSLASLGPAEAAASLKASLDMGVSGGVIYVKAERKSPEEAWAIVDYMKDKVQSELVGFSETRLSEARDVLEKLRTQYENKLEASERNLRDFKVYNQIDLAGTSEEQRSQAADLEMSTTGANAQVSQFVNLFELHSKNEVQLKSLLAKLQSLQEQMAKEPAFVVKETTSERSAISRQMEQLLAKSTSELEAIRQGRTPEHPLVKEKQEEIDRIRMQYQGVNAPVVKEESRTNNPLLEQLRMQSGMLQAEIGALKQEQTQLLSQISQMRDRIKEIPGKELEKARLMREMGIQASMYTEIRMRYEKALLTHELEKEDRQMVFVVLGEATRSDVPVRPNKKFIYIMGTFLGMIIGIVLCFVREFTDTSFRNLDDASRFLDLPVLGVIPEVTGAGRGGALRRHGRRRHQTPPAPAPGLAMHRQES